jgi:two-component system sensor histidine kinase KdpD
MGMPRPKPRPLLVLIGTASLSLALATVVVAFLESTVGASDASTVYLVAVVITAYVAGTAGAVTAALGSFLLYDFFFTEPYGTFEIHDPGIVINALLLLFVGVVVGQLTALQRSRAAAVEAREREARALFHLSRVLATRTSTRAILGDIARILQDETRARRVWVSLGADDASERVAADTSAAPTGASTGAAPPPLPVSFASLKGGPAEDGRSRWIRIHRSRPGARTMGTEDAFRVRLQPADVAFGSIWGLRDRGLGDPDHTETRLLSAAADQLGLALAHDRLAAESQAAEVARQSDALKSALLQSVSHDLRTPLATIRAAAGSLDPESGLDPDEQRESVAAIDREVEYLNRLVTNLLDLSRIEAGALIAERDVYELDDLVGRSLERLGRRIGDRPLDVDLDAPPVDLDPTFLDEAIANIVENALKYTPPGTALRLHASELDGDTVRLTIEDAGPGVPDASLERLFDKFYRVPGGKGGSRSGTGVGLAVVRGLIEATGGRVSGRRSELGGLAIDLDLPRAAIPLAPEVPVAMPEAP